MNDVKGMQKIYDNTMAMLKIMEEESDSIMYLFDVKKQSLLFHQDTLELLGASATGAMPLSDVMNMSFLDEESRDCFQELHRKVSEGSNEAEGMVKIRQKRGIQAVYQLRLRIVYDQNRENTGICMGRLLDVTQHYVKTLALSKYSKYVAQSQVFDYIYDGKKDCFSILLPNKSAKKREQERRNTFFFTKMIKEERVCPRANIAAFLEFLQHGTVKPFQVRMYDVYSEEYRWYAFTGEIMNEKDKLLAGTMQDVTDLKSREYSALNYDRVLECLEEDFLLMLAVDIKLDTYETLLGDYERVGMLFPKEGTYSKINDMIAEHAEESFAKLRKEFGSIAHLTSVLKQKKKLVMIYKTRNYRMPWRKVVIRVMEYDENGVPEKVIVEHIYLEQEDIIQYGLLQPVVEADVQQEKRPQVLLVEEYELNAKLAAEVMEEQGFKMKWAKSAEEALQYVNEADKDTYKLILVDFSLTGKAGLETGRRIRALMEREDKGEAGIYGLTMQETEEIYQEAVSAGMNGCMQKPVQAEQLSYIWGQHGNRKE